jgi:hypothetical protein
VWRDGSLAGLTRRYRIAIERGGDLGCCCGVLECEIVGVAGLYGGAEFLEAGYIGVRDEAAVVGCYTEHQLRSVTYGFVVGFQ